MPGFRIAERRPVWRAQTLAAPGWTTPKDPRDSGAPHSAQRPGGNCCLSSDLAVAGWKVRVDRPHRTESEQYHVFQPDAVMACAGMVICPRREKAGCGPPDYRLNDCLTASQSSVSICCRLMVQPPRGAVRQRPEPPGEPGRGQNGSPQRTGAGFPCPSGPRSRDFEAVGGVCVALWGDGGCESAGMPGGLCGLRRMRRSAVKSKHPPQTARDVGATWGCCRRETP